MAELLSSLIEDALSFSFLQCYGVVFAVCFAA
jgi:hypothetical protein